MAVNAQASFTPRSLRELEGIVAGLRTAGIARPSLTGQGVIAAVAEVLNEHMKRQFVAGTDKEGRSHNKTGTALASFHVEPHALGAYVVADGAARLVETGFRAHQIVAHGGYLKFTTASGDIVFTKRVNHPGYKGDPFVERAWDEMGLPETFVMSIVSDAYARVFMRAGGVL
jgi:hypothetical protein